MSGLGDRGELGEVESSSIPEGCLPGGGSRFDVFQGFSLPAEIGEALVNRRTIFVLLHAASVILACALRSPVISDSSDSRRLPPHAITSAAASSLVGSSRRFDPSSVGRLLSPGSGVVAGAVAPGIGHIACAGIPRPRLLVPRPTWVGSPLVRRGRFRPLVSGRSRTLDQCQGAPGGGEGSASILPSDLRLHGSRLCGQLYGGGVSAQAGRNSFSDPQLHCSADPPLSGVSPDCSSFPVHHGEEQCAGGLSVQTQPSPGFGVDSQVGSFSGSSQEVAGDDGPLCYLSKSLLFTLFFALPRSEGSGDRCSSSKLGWTSGVRFSTLVPHSAGSEETPLVLRISHDSGGSILASEALVSRPVRSGDGRSSSTSFVSRSSQTVSLPLPSSRDPQAVSSCLATVQRFARAEGFSSRVASQIGFSRRASSCANYQVKWLVYRQWCRSESHSISRPTLPKIADFLFWLRRTRKLSMYSILGYCSMLSSVFWFKLPKISSPSVLKDLLHSFKVEAPVRSVRSPPWDLDVVLRYLISSTFEPLTSIPLRSLTKKVSFLLALPTAKRVGELQALSRYVSFSSSGACVAYVPEFFAKTESALHPLPRSFLVKSLSDFAVGLD